MTPLTPRPALDRPLPASPGSSAPVAIVLALALAATVGVSAQSWDVKAAAAAGSRPSGAASGTPEDGEGASLLRLLVDWARRGRATDCGSPAR